MIDEELKELLAELSGNDQKTLTIIQHHQTSINNLLGIYANLDAKVKMLIDIAEMVEKKLKILEQSISMVEANQAGRH